MSAPTAPKVGGERLPKAKPAPLLPVEPPTITRATTTTVSAKSTPSTTSTIVPFASTKSPATTTTTTAPKVPAATATASTAAGSPTTADLDPNAGWEPTKDGRFRVSLRRRFRDEVGSPELDEITHTPRAGDIMEPDTPTTDALCNACVESDPHAAFTLQASLVNAINSAYTSSGYPSIVTGGNARGAVYGSFVDLKNPSLHSIALPPKETIIVAPSDAGGLNKPGEPPAMETLLRVRWKRSGRVFVPESKDGQRPGVSQSAVKQATTNPTVSSSAAALVGVTRPSAALLAHIQQFPEGVHGINSSPYLRHLLLQGELPYPGTAAAAAGETAVAAAAASGGAAGGGGANTTPPAAGAGAGEGGAASAAPGGGGGNTANPGATAAANMPPPPLAPTSTAPVQHTLVSANTFNHLSVYFVAHQDGRFLFSTPLQTMSASIATRKITAHKLFLLGQEGVEPHLWGSEYEYTSTDRKNTGNPSTSATRDSIVFSNTPVPRDIAPAFFSLQAARFVDADAKKGTIAVANVGFVVEALLLFGNQNGDLFVFSVAREKIVQRLNFNAGSNQCTTSVLTGSGAGKLICSPVADIVEVQNGLELKLSSMAQYAAAAKRNRKGAFKQSDALAAASAADGGSGADTFYSLSPSLFAVGFDNGQILLICVTTQGAWMLKHFTQGFGSRPIQSMAVRVPSLYTRLWTSYALATEAAAPTAKASTSTSETGSLSLTTRTTLVSADATLFVHEEEQHIAAISCGDGAIVLVRLPGLEVLSCLTVFEYNAVGDLTTLCWTASGPSTLLTPDILIASGEDDTLTAFQLVLSGGGLGGTTSSSHGGAGGGGTGLTDRLSNDSSVSGAVLRVLEKKKFHQSWVTRLTALPLIAPPQRGMTSAVGMPVHLGTCLVATSYDARTSFWPIPFAGSGVDPSTAEYERVLGLASYQQQQQQQSSGGGALGSSGVAGAAGQYLLIEGPTAAYSLHSELVVSCHVAGGGSSYFLATVCCRGKVKLWSVNLQGDFSG